MKIRNHAYKIVDLFGLPGNTKGEVGLEIETIGKNLPMAMKKTKLWSVHPDASVKARPGEVTAEYVFSQPVGRPKVTQALEELMDEFKTHKSTIAEGRISNSVHVHINAQQLSMQQVYTWLTVYFIFEELLVRWAGTHRVGNLFCLRARDAEGLIKMLARSIREDQFNDFRENSSGAHYRYAAVNVQALPKFGSLEFRALRGTCQQQIIEMWIETLLAIKDASLTYNNPTDVLADFSRRSPVGFAAAWLPSEMRHAVMHEYDFMDSLYDGARLAQDFAFAIPWGENKINPSPAEGSFKKKPKSAGWGDATPPMVYNQLLNSFTSFQDEPIAAPHPIVHVWMGYVQPDGRFAENHGSSVDGLMRQIRIRDSMLASLNGVYHIGWRTTNLHEVRKLAVFRNTTGIFVQLINSVDYEILV